MPPPNYSNKDLGDDKEHRPREELSGSIDQGADTGKLVPIEAPVNDLSNRAQWRAKMIHVFLQNAQSFPWSNPRKCEQAKHYFSAFEPILQPNKNSGVFFTLLRSYVTWNELEVKGFVNWIGSGPYRALLTNKESNVGYHDFSPTPLIYAIDRGMSEFVVAILQVDGIPVDTLYKVKSYGTCLHQAIKQESPSIEFMARSAWTIPISS